MKYLRQFLLILLISFIGELLHEVLPLPVPASVYGFAILFIGLLSGAIKLEHVQDTGKLLGISGIHLASHRLHRKRQFPAKALFFLCCPFFTFFHKIILTQRLLIWRLCVYIHSIDLFVIKHYFLHSGENNSPLYIISIFCNNGRKDRHRIGDRNCKSHSFHFLGCKF